jgi:hypothetical protein
MDNSFTKAMETVAGAIWSQLMLKGKAEVSVNGSNVSTISLDVHVAEQVSGGRPNVSPVSSGPRPTSSMTPPPPPPPSSVFGSGSGSE